LKEHTSALDEENLKLENELHKLLEKTQEQLQRKRILEEENSQLEREERLRQDLIRIRLERIQKAQIKSDLLLKKEKEKQFEKRKLQMMEIIKNRKNNDELLSDGLDPLDLEWYVFLIEKKGQKMIFQIKLVDLTISHRLWN
jgi:hypothetical protein